MGAGKSKNKGQVCRLEIQISVDVAALNLEEGFLCCSLEAELLLLWETLVCVLKSFNSLDKATHIVDGNLLYSESTDYRCWASLIAQLVKNPPVMQESPVRFSSVQFSSVQWLSHVRLFATSWISARQASLSITNSRSSLRLKSIESVIPSSHLILCHPPFLLPPSPPSISLFQWINSSHEVAKVLEFQL